MRMHNKSSTSIDLPATKSEHGAAGAARAAHRFGVDGVRGVAARHVVDAGVLAGRRRARRLPRAGAERGAACPSLPPSWCPASRAPTPPRAARCPAACALVVKQRDGRPIKIEGNEASPLTGGGTCAVGQASVLGLYDDGRLRGPLLDGRGGVLARHRRAGRAACWRAAAATRARWCCCRGPSPALRRRRRSTRSRAAHPTFQHVVYDADVAVGACARRTGALRRRRRPALSVRPRARRRRARSRLPGHVAGAGGVCAAIRARAHRRSRRGSFHVQLESGVSVTGSNADLRLAVPPSDWGWSRRRCSRRSRAAARAPALAAAVPSVAGAPHAARHRARRRQSWSAHRGASLVVSGSDDPAAQVVVAALNTLLGNVGTTLDVERPSLQQQADDGALPALIDDMQRGGVRVLLLWGANPVYDHPDGRAFRAALAKVALSVSFADRRDETAAHVARRLPGPPLPGVVGRRRARRRPLQPAPAADRAAARHARGRREPAHLGGRSPPDAHTHVRDFWRRQLFPRAPGATAGFDDFWDRALERGAIELPLAAVAPRPRAVVFRGDVGAAVHDRAGGARPRRRATATSSTCTRRVARARRPAREQPVAAGAARSDHAADVGQRRRRSHPRPPRR